MCPLEGEAVPNLKPNKVVLKIQHIASNLIVRLDTFVWAFRAEGVNPLARTFVHLHATSICKKLHFFEGVKTEVCYGQVFTYPQDHTVILVKAYKDLRETAWLSKLFY